MHQLHIDRVRHPAIALGLALCDDRRLASLDLAEIRGQPWRVAAAMAESLEELVCHWGLIPAGLEIV
jgi:hypothetical protein